jgi:hypothetical protein
VLLGPCWCETLLYLYDRPGWPMTTAATMLVVGKIQARQARLNDQDVVEFAAKVSPNFERALAIIPVARAVVAATICGGCEGKH